MNWIEGGGLENNIILSSRIRLARNINNTPFPAMLDKAAGTKVVNSIYNEETKKGVFDGYKFYDMQDTGSVERYVLVERHLISPNLAAHGSKGAVLIDRDEVVSIMLNEEDHIRIQTLLPGMQVREALEKANRIDDMVESMVVYAYDERLGYLTSCPTNVGTGIRASMMVHLPGLNLTSNISKILHAVSQIGLTIRGLYGEGTEFIGNLFQISNQITLGRSEEEIVESLIATTKQIIDKENESRSSLMKNNRLQLEDKIWRSWGIISNARVISASESMKLLSDIRLGVDLGVLKDIHVSVLNEIMVDSNNASLQKNSTTELNAVERDIIRAEKIRMKLA
ncbi:MAG: protein arginine kinase [Lutisporaceae bacterium]